MNTSENLIKIYVDMIAKRGLCNFAKDENTYLDETDGFFHCNACKEPRQAIMKNPIIDVESTVAIRCSCIDKAEEKIKREELLREREIYRKRVLTSVRQRESTFENDDGKLASISNRLKKYCLEFEQCLKINKGLYLCGNCGTGKTFYAGCIANELITQGYRVGYTSIPEVLSISTNFDVAADFWDRIFRNNAVIIDDFGTERSTTFANEQVYRLINGCYENKVIMIITSNIDFEQLKKQSQTADDFTMRRIIDRICEVCVPISVNGISRRI